MMTFHHFVIWRSFSISIRVTNTIWLPIFEAPQTAENTTSLQPPFSDRPLLSWQHDMAQHLLGFSCMASENISCPSIRLPLPQISCPPWEPATHSSLQSHQGSPLPLLVCTLWVSVFWGSLSAAEMLLKGLSHLITASDVQPLFFFSFLSLWRNSLPLSSCLLFNFFSFVF